MYVFLEHIQQYQLGTWVVCPRTNTLTNNPDTHSIDNKSMQVLLFLIQHAGENVTKEQIFEHVWKGSVVADDILSVAISKIRKALGDNARSPTFIKILPNVGYSLIAAVDVIKPTDNDNQQKNAHLYLKIAVVILLLLTFLIISFSANDKGSPTEQINIHSIAVLPFEDLSVTQDNQHFTDGLPDAIINQLSQIKQLKVISRHSSFTYRGNYNAAEIGQALQVDTLLDGSVQIMGEQVRINVRIFSTENGQQLWSKTFDSEAQDIFNIQDNISSAIKATIGPEVASSLKPTKAVNAQAYEWYLMGQYHWRQKNPKSVAKALSYFKQSLELAPDYAEAHVGLAITYSLLHSFGDWDIARVIETALPHVERALTLQPNSSTALATKGMLLSDKAFYQATFKDINDVNNMSQLSPALYQQAEQAFTRSLELDNNATTHRWYSGLLKRIGREEEAIEHLNQAIKLNPLSASLKRSIGFSFEVLGKQDTAQRIFQRALILEPNYFSQVVDSATIYRQSTESMLKMAAWQVANAELFTNCSSEFYCSRLIMSYLAIGAKDAANNILANMPAKNVLFRQWLNAIAASEQGNEQEALSYLENLALKYPNNRNTLFKLATAQFRAGEYRHAQETLLNMYPQWGQKLSNEENEITADNYLAMVLYAVSLSNLQEEELADSLLHAIQTFIKQGQGQDPLQSPVKGKVFDKIKAEFTLAEINAQLGNTSQALNHLATALDMGWLESYNQEWWPLQNNHLLRPLHQAPKFNLLLNQHKAKRDQLRGKVEAKLSTFPRLIE